MCQSFDFLPKNTINLRSYIHYYRHYAIIQPVIILNDCQTATQTYADISSRLGAPIVHASPR